MVTSNLHPKLDIHCIPLMFSLVSLEEAVHIISVILIAAELLPYRLIDEVIIM